MRMPQSMGNNMNMPGPMNPMMMGGMNMNPGMKQGPMNNMNMMNPRHPAMMQAGASNNPAGGPGWPQGGQGGPQGVPGGPQGGPGGMVHPGHRMSPGHPSQGGPQGVPGVPQGGMVHPGHRMSPGHPSQQGGPGGPQPPNSSMAQQTLSSPMNRASPSVMSGPNSGDNPGAGMQGPGPNMNPRTMGAMPPNIEAQRGSPGIPPQGKDSIKVFFTRILTFSFLGDGMMGHRPGPHPQHMRNGGPGPGPGQPGPGGPNFPGNMPNQMSQQVSQW